MSLLRPGIIKHHLAHSIHLVDLCFTSIGFNPQPNGTYVSLGITRHHQCHKVNGIRHFLTPKVTNQGFEKGTYTEVTCTAVKVL